MGNKGQTINPYVLWQDFSQTQNSVEVKVVCSYIDLFMYKELSYMLTHRMKKEILTDGLFS